MFQPHLFTGFSNFLSNRPQCVRVGDIMTPVLVSSTGAPQGCVLSPFFTPCIKMTVGVLIHLPNLWGFLMIQPCLLIWGILPHTSYIFLQWCVSLVGAVTMCCIWMFPKRKKCASTSVVIELSLVLLSSTVNLGVILDEKLSFTEHVTAVQNNSQQRLNVLRKSRGFYVDPLLLLRLYRSKI